MFKGKCLPTAADDTINDAENVQGKSSPTAADDTINDENNVQGKMSSNSSRCHFGRNQITNIL